MIIVGIDAHTRRHSAAVIDEHGRVLDVIEVGAGVDELDRLIAWIAEFRSERLVAVEGAKGFGLALTRRLLEAGERVVDIATHLTADGRRSSRRRGKDDEIDAITIARVAMREPDLPRLTVEQLDADLKLLVDARDQLVAESTRVRNRLHALLLVLALGYRDDTGALSNKAALARAKRLVMRGRAAEPVRAKLALAAIGRLRQFEREAADVEVEIKSAIAARQPTRLLGICGVGPIVAAKILGETRGVERFPDRCRVRVSHRHSAVASLERADHTTPSKSWREPPAQPRPVHRRHGPSALESRCPRLPRTQASRGQERCRGAPLPQAPPREDRLRRHARRRPGSTTSGLRLT